LQQQHLSFDYLVGAAIKGFLGPRLRVDAQDIQTTPSTITISRTKDKFFIVYG